MTNNDYEKTKQECWGDLYNEKLRYETQIEQVSRRKVFDYAFDRAYQLGKADAESDRDAEILKTHLKVEHYLSEERIQLAGMAMQGLLNATSVERFTLRIKPEVIARTAVEYADALLNELNKEDNDTDSNK